MRPAAHAVPLNGHRASLCAAVALSVLVAGCASSRGLPGVSPAEVPHLEARLAQSPGELPTMLRLGAAYREAGRLAESRSLLEAVRERAPDDPVAALQLGLTYEAQGFYANARALYQSYIERGAVEGLREALESRLPVLRRLELQAEVRAALAREAELAAATPQPNAVAVFPFPYRGSDPSLRPLSRAFAELLTTDLGQVDRLTVLERVHVQALLDELELGASGRVDPATAARSGRILGAGRIVQGQIDGGNEALLVDALVVNVSGGDAVARPVQEQDALQRLFDAEKRLALAIFEAMGIQLTAAERERVNRRPTENVQALLAFGLGLEAEDAGDFRRAAQQFDRAVSLDPGFDLARQRGELVTDAALGAAISAGQLARLSAVELNVDPELETWLQLQVALPSLEALVPSPEGRDAAVELLGLEGIAPDDRAYFELIFRRPQQ